MVSFSYEICVLKLISTIFALAFSCFEDSAFVVCSLAACHNKHRLSCRLTVTVHIKDSFIGKKPICNIKNSDMLKFYNGLLDKGLSSGYLHIMNAFLSPAFDLAVDDDLIRKNPCNNIMTPKIIFLFHMF